MKKILLMFMLAPISLFSCAQHPADVSFTLLTDETFEGQFYPSLAIWNSALEDPSDLFFAFALNVPEANDVIRITVEESHLNSQTVIQRTATEPGEVYIEDIIIKWKYKELAKLEQAGSETLTFILEINGKEVDRINHTLRFRPVNECVFSIWDAEGETWLDTRTNFAQFVNEDYPQIDKILGEVLSYDRNRQFIDYQGGGQELINQIFWIWEYFSLKGTRYSNVVNSSNASQNLGVQYVRFFDQVIDNVQANCVDGSALLASIYAKIGLNAYLVLVPGHCMLAIESPYPMNFGERGSINSESGGIILIETTLMGANSSPLDSFNQAITAYNWEDVAYKMETEDFMLVGVRESREMGIVPISREYHK